MYDQDPYSAPMLGTSEVAPTASYTVRYYTWASRFLPSMAEINAIPYNGYKVVSTFSGCGGSSLGYRWAGYQVVYANEFIKYAYDSYKANFPNTILDGRDIREVEPEDILERTGLAVGELDLFDGSPPCAPYSEAGVKDKKWGEKKRYSTIRQRTDDLFDNYLRILCGLKPKVFVAENVTGLLQGRAKGEFIRIIQAVTSMGYNAEARVINTMYLGVPQNRERVIIIGVRKDLGLLPSYPEKHALVTSLREALAGVNPYVEPDASDLPLSVQQKYSRLAYNQDDEQHYNLRRSSWDIPAYTVCASGGDKHTKTIMHPDECRKFSIAELKRISSLPDDFVLTSSYRHQYERMGRLFPPLAMKQIAEKIQTDILDKVK